MANWRNAAGSIKAESNAIFMQAKTAAETVVAPTNFCPKGCTAPERGKMLFRSTPNKFRSGYSEAAHCDALFALTSKQPLIYQNDRIETVDDLNQWIGDISQGSGKEGRDLYKKCDGSCSPRFEYHISKNLNSTGYSVKASIVCGAARDKDDGQYVLESLFRWVCQKKEGK
jgi:hypothetical protein